MNGGATPDGSPTPERPDPDESSGASPAPTARLHTRRPFHLVWLIPVVALAIAGFLGWRAVERRGPTIEVTFLSADGLAAGQTRVKHKAVELGTVRNIELADDMSHVRVRIEMRREATRVLTENARFWVVRPRLSVSNISGLDTLVSGSYIELDPGTPDDKPQREYTGLEEPPAVRSDEPGQTFTLKSSRIAALATGSPVFYRDISVGEVLGYDLGPNGDSVTIHAFIRHPFDGFVKEGSHFWNVSGVGVELGASGVRVRLESFQALLNGGVAFDTPREMRDGKPPAPGQTFELYPDIDAANSAGFRRRIPFVSYLDTSVRGLAVGAPVELYGLQIGNVTDVRLEVDPFGTSSRVAVRYEIQPERILPPDQVDRVTPLTVARNFVDRGYRVQLQSANLVTGQLVVGIISVPGAGAADVHMDGDAIVLPVQPGGGLEGITSALGTIAAKIDALPLDQIAKHLDDTLKGTAALTNGPELKQSLTALNGTLVDVRELVRKADAGITPLLKRMPEIATSVQATVDRTARLIGSADSGYGAGSEFNRNLQRLLVQASDTARSVRLLADYLDQHPEALLRGRTDAGR